MKKLKVLAKCFTTFSVVYLKLNRCDTITFMDIKTNSVNAKVGGAERFAKVTQWGG